MDKNSLLEKIILLFRPFKRHVFVLSFANFIGYIIGAIAPWWLGKAIDALQKNSSHDVVFWLSLSCLATALQALVFSLLVERYSEKHWDYDISRFINLHSIGKLFGYSVGQHINEHSGVKQSIVNKGQNALVQLLNSMIYMVTPTVIQIIATLIVIAFFDWRISALSFILASLYCFFAYLLNKSFFPKIEEIRKKRQDQSKLQSELFRNTTLVIAEAQEQSTIHEFDSSYEQIDRLSQRTWSSFLSYFYLNRSIVVFGRYAVLALGIYLVFRGKLTVGVFIALVSWVGTIFGNLIMIMNQQRQMLFMITEIKKFFSLLEIKPDIDINEKGKMLRKLMGEIEFKDVSFAYPKRVTSDDQISEEREHDHAVSGISFIIPAGAKVGLVGLSGSGKSTIINLLRRYYDPSFGDIFIDGVNLKDINLRWLRTHIGNVEQKIDLFDRSVKENILFGLPDKKRRIPRAEFERVLEDSSLNEFIEKLPAGINTMIGEGGIKVSGGERQRIGIARALIKNPKILIFDEATSALDSHNEKLIHDAINRGSIGRTTIIVAHRLSTIADADIIFVVDDGKIVGQGSHDELSLSCPEYQKLIKHQLVEVN